MFCFFIYWCRVKVVSRILNWISISPWFSSLQNPVPCLFMDRFCGLILIFLLWFGRWHRWFVHRTVACMCGVFRLCSSCWREGFLLPTRSLGAGSSIFFLSFFHSFSFTSNLVFVVLNSTHVLCWLYNKDGNFPRLSCHLLFLFYYYFS